MYFTTVLLRSNQGDFIYSNCCGYNLTDNFRYLRARVIVVVLIKYQL